jgi:hypothetical protein
LAYEAPPDAVVQARDYLVAVFKDQEEVLHDRMDALKLARRFEAAKVTPRTIHTTRMETDRREAWRNYELAERERKIILATKDTPPEGWADDLLSDGYVPPAEGWPGPAPVIALKDLVVARKTRQDRLEREAIKRLRHVSSEQPQLLALLAQRRIGNGGDEPSDS